MSRPRTILFTMLLAVAAIWIAVVEHSRAHRAELSLAAVTNERDALRERLAQRPRERQFAQTQVPRAPGLAVRTGELPRAMAPNETVAAVPVAPSGDVGRLERYRRKLSAFVRQRSLTPAQAGRLAEILCEWDDVSRDFQAGIRERGLSATPAAQRQRDELQQQIENRPLVELLGQDGAQAYFDFERQSFYAAMATPVIQGLADANVQLTPEQSAHLLALVEANVHGVKKDPASMSSRAVIDWDAVVLSAQAFLSAEQIQAMRAAVAAKRAAGG